MIEAAAGLPLAEAASFVAVLRGGEGDADRAAAARIVPPPAGEENLTET